MKTIPFVPVHEMLDVYRDLAIRYARQVQEETGEGLGLSESYIAQVVDQEARAIAERGEPK
jgi:hypothetical protein